MKISNILAFITAVLFMGIAMGQINTNLNIEKVIVEVRNHYLEPYRQRIQDYKQQPEPSFQEILVEFKEREGDLVYKVHRIDIVAGSEQPLNLIEFNLDGQFLFEPMKFSIENTKFDLSPIQWNGVEFELTPTISDDSKIQDWALSWIDLDEKVLEDEYGLGNYVHSIVKEAKDSEISSFSIDFGSSEVEAFLSFINLLAEFDIKSVRIHSDWQYE